MLKRLLRPLRLPRLPDSAHLRRDLGLGPSDCRDDLLARQNPNLGGWV